MAKRYTVPGPCTISWAGTNLGYTKAGIELEIDSQLVPIVDDEHGTEPADYIRAGKAAVVTATFNDMVKVLAASPFIGKLLSNLDGSSNTQVGKISNDGAGGTQLAKEIIITERDPTNLWKAKFALPSDPTPINLQSTQEQLLMIRFAISLDDDDKLFYVVPTYMRP